MPDKFITIQEKQSRITNFGLRLVEREKKKIAGELHDNVATNLSIIKLKLYHNPNDLSDVISLLDQTISSVRNISHDLHKQSLDHISFLDAIRDFALPLNDILEVKIECPHVNNISLNEQTKLNLFRILQEVTNNILKHANATHILIKLFCTKSFLHLSIDDNGKGFSLKNSLNKIGIGLENIKYRAKELQASYEFINSKNKGTTFLISVPITK